MPEDWTGAIQQEEYHDPPARSTYVYTTTLAEAQLLPYWRDPALSAGWTFEAASAHPEEVLYGYQAGFLDPGGKRGFLITTGYLPYRGVATTAAWRSTNGLGIAETRVIADRPAQVMYSPPGPSNSRYFPVKVWVYDAATESLYTIDAREASLLGANVDAVIAIARGFFEPPNPP